MLVLSRKKDEKLVIGQNVIITVVEIQPGRVKIGIEAPQEVPVHRQEVYDAIHAKPTEEPTCPQKPPS